MPQNAPQCPVPTNEHDALSPAPQDAPPDNPQSAIANSQLSDRQLLAIDFLVLGHAETAVAEALHIDRKTLYRWRHDDDPQYRDTLGDHRKELLDTTADRFRTMLTTALDTFARHLADPYAPTAHRAARSLLALAAIGRQPHASPPPQPQPLTTDNGQRTLDAPHNAARTQRIIPPNTSDPVR